MWEIVCYNFLLLTVAGFLMDAVNRYVHINKVDDKIVRGIIFGIAAILCTLRPYMVASDFFTDGRFVTLYICSLFYGPLSASVTLVIEVLYLLIVKELTLQSFLLLLLTISLGAASYGIIKSKNIRISMLNLVFWGLPVSILFAFVAFFMSIEWRGLSHLQIGFLIFAISEVAIVVVGAIFTLVVTRHAVLLDLKESKDDLNFTLKSIGEAVIQVDTREYVVRMNSMAEQLTGWSEKEAIGLPIDSIYRAKDTQTKQLCNDHIISLLVERKEREHYSILETKSGYSYFYVSERVSVINNGTDVKGFVLVFSDITNRIEVQNAFDREHNLLRTVFDAVPLGLYVKNLQCQKIMTNKADSKIIGRPVSEILGKNDFEMFPDEYARKYFEDDKTVISSGKPVINREEEVLSFDGKKRWLQTSKYPWIHDNGEILGIIGLCTDVTDRVDKDRQIKKLSEGIIQSPYAVVMTNSTGIIEFVNPRFTEMTGLQSEDAIGKSLWSMRSYAQQPELMDSIRGHLKTHTRWVGEFLTEQNPCGSSWEQVAVSQMFDDKHNATNYLVLIEDITDRKRLMEDLVHATKKAEENDKLKTAFLANMSHEIRTPMNGILGFSELLKDEHLEDNLRTQYLDIIEKSGLRMLNIINDIVDMSKIEVDQIIIYDESAHINEIVKYQFNLFEVEASAKELDFEYKLGLDDVADFVITDPTRLGQVLSNLIKNAIKFTNKGRIDVGYNLRDDKMLYFYVTDTGIGIDESMIEEIFVRFRQADVLTTRHYEGAGLGLSISKALVEMMGGAIGVTSKLGEGSSFFFTIPYRQPGN